MLLKKFALFASGAGGDVINLDGHTVSDFQDSPTDSYARIKFDNDGNVYSSGDTGTPSWVQKDTAADWIRPTTSSPGLYEIRWTAASSTVTSSTAAEDVWYDFSSGDFIIYNRFIGPVGGKSTSFTIEIRLNGGSVLDSASYNVNANTESGA